MPPLWTAAAQAAMKATKAAAAAARAHGNIEASATLTASAQAIAATIEAAESIIGTTFAGDAEVEARTQAARRCIVASVSATRAGRAPRRASDVLASGHVAMRNLAMHDFALGEGFAGLTPEQATRRQRGGRRQWVKKSAASTANLLEESGCSSTEGSTMQCAVPQLQQEQEPLHSCAEEPLRVPEAGLPQQPRAVHAGAQCSEGDLPLPPAVVAPASPRAEAAFSTDAEKLEAGGWQFLRPCALAYTGVHCEAVGTAGRSNAFQFIAAVAKFAGLISTLWACGKGVFHATVMLTMVIVAGRIHSYISRIEGHGGRERGGRPSFTCSVNGRIQHLHRLQRDASKSEMTGFT